MDLGGAPRAFTEIADMKAKIASYLSSCKADDRPLTMAGLCVDLDICRETLSKYASGEYDDDNNRFSDTIKKTKLRIEMDKNEGMISGRYNASGTIFDLKNNHGYRDKIEASIAATEMSQEQWLETLK